MAFDLSSIEFLDVVEINIRHPKTNAPTDMFLQVASYSSDRLKAKARLFANSNLKSRAQTQTIEKSEDHVMDMAVAVVTGWRGVEENKKPLDCTPENVKRFLNLDASLFNQVHAIASDSAAFIKA